MTADRGAPAAQSAAQAAVRGPARGHEAAAGRGILCMMAGSALLISNDALVKWLASDLPVGQVMFLRGGIFLSLLSLLLWRSGQLGALRIHNRRDLALRAGLVVTASFLFFNGLRFLPLADATAIAFAGPLFTVALAVPLLGERVGWRRWSAVIVGFAGVLLAMRPSGAGLAWAALLPLGAAFCASLRDILTRRLNVTEASLGILFYTTAAVTLAGLATAPFGWRPVAFETWGLFAAAALLMGGAHYLQIEAFRYADTVTIAPYRYSALIWSVALGYLVWGHLPGGTVAAGALIIAASGLYIWYRERGRGLEPAPVPAPIVDTDPPPLCHAPAMDGISIREFDAKDRPALIELARELQTAEAAFYDRMKPPGDIGGWYVDYLLEACERNKGTILVAVDGGNLVGYAAVLTEVSSEGERDEVDYSYALVQDIAVTARLRGQGVGSRLLARAEELARESGAGWLRLAVLTDNAAAVRVYGKAGFKPLSMVMEKPIGG